MLEIKNISKIYNTAGFKQKALDKVSINFRNKEFVSILGPSGSGKTTLLNIIGGLDSYTSGDLIIDNISTKKYKDRAWDSYRNEKVGFVFQNYNLITHQTVLKNVELALTLSGISKDERRKRAKDALKDVGLLKHINKKPNQLSGGQMQRVAIARALVNNPEIILADEPTGALDSDTSIEVMKLLKKISKDKLVIMVTHNPELAKEYSTRIINIKDGKIESDSNSYKNGKKENITNNTNSKTKMSFLTALSLSFNNLMTKKGRTLLVALAGSIGIIGIALILAVSTGFKNYVNGIEKSTLTSYPLTIYEKSSDALGILLSMQNEKSDDGEKNKLKEKQYITSMLSSVSNNDLKSFKTYLEKNDSIKKDLSNVIYSYNVSPNIYTKDEKNKIAKVNPSDIFSNMMGGSNMMGVNASVYSEMMPNISDIEDDYDVLKGRWPKKYNEMIIVLSDKNSISDLLVYSLGLREVDELNNMVSKIMNGETVKLENAPKTFTYDDLLNVDLRLINSADTFKYNSKYDVYEDMTDNKSYMKNIYKDSEKLKIVGIISPKKGKTTTALNPGIVYTSSLTKHIINYSKDTEIVKKQLKNKKTDIFSGNKFNSKNNNFDFSFEDLVKVDSEKLQNVFNIDIDSKSLENETKKYINDISNSITVDYSKEENLFNKNLKNFSNDILSKDYNKNDIDKIVDKYLDSNDASITLSNMENKYLIPKSVYKKTYSGLLKGLLTAYSEGYNTYMKVLDPSYDTSKDVKIEESIKSTVINSYLESTPVKKVETTLAKTMHEAVVKKEVLTKVGELTTNISSSFVKAFNIDEDAISSCFSLNFSEDELKRVVTALLNDEDKTLKNNLNLLGYQDLNDPSSISFYFKSFESKEKFIKYIDNYNKKVSKDKKLNYTDASGILMSSVKTIVNAVSYVLIAFVSISLVVSSIMIGVITYISVYERTKEIGILRSIGASKRNISEVFNAETFIIGLLSGILGVSISYSLIPIINIVLHHHIGDEIIISASLKVEHALILIGLSIILTIIGGLIPARAASKKDPVEALRTE